MTTFDRIENLRKSKGISQGKLERELGFSNGSISKWKNSTPTPGRLQKLADYFGVSMDYLLNGTDIIIESPESSQECGDFSQVARILAYYNALNDIGKFEATKRVQELTHLTQYATDDVALLNAAHALENASLEDKQHDEDIMNDENF